MTISTAKQLADLSLGTINLGMSQYGGLPSARTLDPPSNDSFLQTLVEARETEVLFKKHEDSYGFQCCFCISATPDARTGIYVIILFKNAESYLETIKVCERLSL